jgi:predicted ATPase with chaperone activity
VLCTSQRNLSARTYDRIRKLAGTIADLARCGAIQSVHLAEALHAPQSAEVDAQHYVMTLIYLLSFSQNVL